MSLIRLYLDEDTSNLALVSALRASDIDVITTLEANKLGCSDEEQLIWATEQNRVIYSFNQGDFSRLHSQFLANERSHAGILLGQQQRYSIGQQVRALIALIADRSAEAMFNQLVFLSAYLSND